MFNTLNQCYKNTCILVEHLLQAAFVDRMLQKSGGAVKAVAMLMMRMPRMMVYRHILGHWDSGAS